jgi:hypothetical protein
MNLSEAYTKIANVLPRPMVTSTEGNSYQYVSKSVGGRKHNVSKRNRTGKKWARKSQHKKGSNGGKSKKQTKNSRR